MKGNLFILLKGKDAPRNFFIEIKLKTIKNKNMRSIKLTVLSLMILFALASCKKEISTEQEQIEEGVNPLKVYKKPTTPEERLLVENIGKVTEIFKELYKDKSNLKVVNAAIFSKGFTDESVLLKELIYPTTSWLNNVEKFKSLTQKWNVSLDRFSQNFWIEAEKKNDPTFTQFLNNLNVVNSATSNTSNNFENQNGEPVTVYFPYSDAFLPPEGGTYEPIASIVTASADTDEGWGNLPFYQDGILQWYVQVLVNDEYAYANPTHIIGVNGIEYELEPVPSEPPPPPPPPPGVSRLYIGEAICKNQYDRLISFTGNGGGSEIKYCHLSGYLAPVNGQVTTFQDIASVDFSRKSIRNKNWKRVFILWDDDWVPADLEQFFAIYEEDNTNTKTFNGSIGTTLSVIPNSTTSTVTGTIGFTVSVTSQDDIIRQLKISRNSYFAGSFQNQGHDFSSDDTFLPLPFTHGWPAYDVHYWNKEGANVGWTWPYNTF